MPIRKSISNKVRKVMLKPGDTGSFEGIPVKRPSADFIEPKTGNTYKCPVCHGHGEYIANWNAFGKGRHLKSICYECNGHGYLKPWECKHRWVQIKKLGPTEYVSQCSVCKEKRTFDSSG